MRPGRGGGAGCQFRVCTAEVETGACPEQGCDGPGPAGRAGRQGWSERQGCGDHGLCGRWWSGVAACVDMAGCCGSARSDTPPAGAVRPVVSPCRRLTPCSTGHGRPDPRPSPPPTQSLEKKLYCVQSCAICSPARAGVRGLCGACSHTVFRPERSRSRGGSPRSGQGQVPVHREFVEVSAAVLPGGQQLGLWGCRASAPCAAWGCLRPQPVSACPAGPWLCQGYHPPSLPQCWGQAPFTPQWGPEPVSPTEPGACGWQQAQ